MKNKGRRERKDIKRDLRVKHSATSIPLKISFGFIVLIYILIPNFTPNWMALDTNAPKFMALAIVNLLSFIVLLFDGDLKKRPGILTGFFRTWPGLAITGLLFMTLVSFFQAINPLESVLELSKLISLFAAAYILSVIFTYDMRYMRMVAFVLAGILIFDSVSVFYFINEFIQGNIARISEIKSVYSNKNILASAIYVKIPAALWLMLFEKSWLRRIGVLALFFGFLSTFFMATRTFYLGLIVASLFFLSYAGYNYFRAREKKHLGLIATYLGAMILALVIFSVIQKNLYPQISSRHTQGVGQQLSTIVTGDISTSIRLEAWGWSGQMIKKSPILGVGAGNWKVASLAYENQTKPDFIYAYKAHNDFLEVTAEKGIPAGLLYIAIFATVFWAFFRIFIRKTADEATYKSLFFAATGMFFYSIDAFFNFPGDRPEIIALLGLYLGTGIAAINIHKQQAPDPNSETATPEIHKGRTWVFYALAAAAILAIGATSYGFYHNFQSSKIQRVIYQEIMSGTLRSPSDDFTGKFPRIPNISHWGESISTLLARYLINDKKFDEAIAVMRDDTLNPYDGRREYFMAISYYEKEMADSALYFSQRSRLVKPMYFRNLQLILNILEKQGRDDESIGLLEDFLSKNKRNGAAWIMASNTYNRVGNLDRAWEVIEEANIYLPADTLIERQHRFLQFRKFIEPHRHLYNSGMEFYQSGNYARALPLFNQYIDSIPEEPVSLRLRALTYYHLRQYTNSINDLNRLVELGNADAAMINLRGACFQGLGDLEAACRDFEASMKEGNASGIQNYERFCAGRQGS